MTMQIPDRLIYEDKEYSMVGGAYPMDAFPAGFRPSFPSFSTACWRGYVATWVVQDGSLWLRSMSGPRFIPDTPSKDYMADLFPGYDVPVKATWVNDVVIAGGGGVKYHGYYCSVKNEYLLLVVKRGEVISTEIKDAKWFINAFPSYQSALATREEDGPWKAEIDPSIVPFDTSSPPPLEDDVPEDYASYFSARRRKQPQDRQELLEKSLVRHQAVMACLARYEAMSEQDLVDRYTELNGGYKDETPSGANREAHLIDKAAANYVVMQRIEGGGLNPLRGTDDEVYPVRRYLPMVDDPQAFARYIVENEAWDLISALVDASAVKWHMKEKGACPPGIKWHSVRELRSRNACEDDESNNAGQAEMGFGQYDYSIVIEEKPDGGELLKRPGED